MRTRLAATALAAALAAGPVSAADANGQFFIMGEPGMMTCGTLLARSNDQQTGVALGIWIAGYTTAMNRILPQTYSIFRNSDLTPFIIDVIAVCGANPNALVEEAVYTALDKAFATKLQRRP